MKRVKRLFAGREVEFIDRDQAIKQVEGLWEGLSSPLLPFWGTGPSRSSIAASALAQLTS